MNPTKSRIDKLFWGGILVGIVIMAAGMLSLMTDTIGTGEARLILCSGIGILFGAFGSTAVIKYKGITITGVAAISIVLLYVVVTLTSSQATFGAITGDIKGAQIEVKGDESYLGANRDRSYEFVIPGDELTRPVFDVYFSFPPDENGEGEQEINFEGIDKNYINKVLGSGRRIEWRFDRERQSLVETETGAQIGRIELPARSTSVAPNNKSGRLSFINEAFAQTRPPGELGKALIDLGSGVASVRRDGRDKLAAIGPSAVDTMMTVLRERGSIYRIRLGILVALNEMIGKNRHPAREVSRRLTQDDIEILVETVNDPDPTIRFYAGEFLYNLGDRRIIKPALSLIRNSRGNPETIDVLSFVIKHAAANLSITEKQETEKELEELINSMNPLKLTIKNSPTHVSPGQMSIIAVIVHDSQNNVVAGSRVFVSAGGGKFLPDATVSFEPKSRLHGPYSASGVTDTNGQFKTWWVCNPCASAYVLSVEASKQGYLDTRGEITIRIR